MVEELESVQNAPEEEVFDWPYPIRYDVENEVEADVIVLGGGISGNWAAISAARKGLKVILIEKGGAFRAGSGGAGCDHWQLACTNPRSKVTSEEMTEAIISLHNGFENGITRYIRCQEAYETFLELEEMGVKIRDTEGEFEGAPFRDPETGFLYTYDYDNCYSFRWWGSMAKPCLYTEAKRLGVEIYDRVMVTSLLTEKGKQGGRVVGATGVNSRTGEFYVFKGKSIVSCMATPERLWVMSTELNGFASCFFDPNSTGEGFDAPWRAGAEFSLMEQTRSSSGGFARPSYGAGCAVNTWYAATIVDANDKEVPWVDRDGRVLETVDERYRPAPGQKFFIHGTHLPKELLETENTVWHEFMGPRLIPDLGERIAKGEFTPPLYADLTSMPEHERRAIFGLMIGQEGKTLVPIYFNYTQAGFDPDKDMLQVPVYPPEGYNTISWMGMSTPQWRSVGFCGFGGAVVNWDLKTSLEGLYAAGMQALGSSDHVGAATTGRYAGRRAADYAVNAGKPVVDQGQIEKEKNRIYGPVKRTKGIEWKELNAGLGRILQEYCGDFKNEESLNIGLELLKSFKAEAEETAYARNPHELVRALEIFTGFSVGEMIFHASLFRKASSFELNFKRLDYPDMDNQEWNKFTTIKLENNKVKHGELPLRFWLLPPYKTTYKQNYQLHCGKE